MALLKRIPNPIPFIEPISQFLFSFTRTNFTSGMQTSVLKQVQLLPIIRPCELHPMGKIQLVKWRKGDFSGRYTGLIESIAEPNIDKDHDNDIVDDVGDLGPNVLKTVARDLLPSYLKQHSIGSPDLCAILGFDGPPETEEFVFIFNLKCHEIEPVLLDQNVPYFPEWFDLDKIPYAEMPADDFHWYPKVLTGKKVKGSFVFGGMEELTIKSFHLEEVQNFNS